MNIAGWTILIGLVFNGLMFLFVWASSKNCEECVSCKKFSTCDRVSVTRSDLLYRWVYIDGERRRHGVSKDEMATYLGVDVDLMNVIAHGMDNSYLADSVTNRAEDFILSLGEEE